MIIGKGLLARAFAPRYADDPDTIIFASGVANSAEADLMVFARERDMLIPLLGDDRRLVYFGSCGSASPGDVGDTPYMRHKRAMEALVADAPNGLVLRLPQVVGVTPNPNTLTNFLRDRILSRTPFTIWANAERNLIDVSDVARIGSHLIDMAKGNRRIFSIASANTLPMPSIVEIFERVLRVKANCNLEPRGCRLEIDARDSLEIAEELGINLGIGYADSVIRKYYEPRT